ncbi:cysteinyl-tRNA synthetase [Dorcoceras hygrometricum]|uniref:Cysteinyl-tRNA synthetase n=1 Tax=Dorcoceras hygrometricum TaxID=472368 RepID=A0A2Z7BYA4_9LAMI|nr:cysteinyl-tRNA synthetase [Dorcoceras hygrometricum]
MCEARPRDRAKNCANPAATVRLQFVQPCMIIVRPAAHNSATIALDSGQPYYLAGDLRLDPTGITRRPALHGRRLQIRQLGPRPEGRLLRQPALEGLTRSALTDSPRKTDRSKSDQSTTTAAARGKHGGGGGL